MDFKKAAEESEKRSKKSQIKTSENNESKRANFALEVGKGVINSLSIAKKIKIFLILLYVGSSLLYTTWVLIFKLINLL